MDLAYISGMFFLQARGCVRGIEMKRRMLWIVFRWLHMCKYPLSLAKVNALLGRLFIPPDAIYDNAPLNGAGQRMQNLLYLCLRKQRDPRFCSSFLFASRQIPIPIPIYLIFSMRIEEAATCVVRGSLTSS